MQRQAMMKKIKTEMEDDLRPEYDLQQLLKRGVRGKYLKDYRAGANLGLSERNKTTREHKA
jgi:hypothetical protein